MNFLIDIWNFFKTRKKYWLFPLLIALAILAGVIFLTKGSLVAPFMYTIF
jgi:hypothetical protein